MVFNLLVTLVSPTGLAKTQKLGPSPEFWVQYVWGEALQICISNKFLDDPENYFQQQMKEGQPFRKMDVDAGGLVGLP